MLIESGYVIQGLVDYLLFIDGSPAGVLEAKVEDKGGSLSSVADQSDCYLASDPKYIPVSDDTASILLFIQVFQTGRSQAEA
ncbi:MAG: hypothetical protein LBL70_01175 [Treponema sp.]|jgi:hypothetical protein|nr:hypothetical protein [Treponema sp.]